MTSLRAYKDMSTHVNEMVLYSLSALQMVAVKKNQPTTIQNTNKSVRDTPKLSKSR